MKIVCATLLSLLYSWPLNHMDFNCMGPLTCGRFSISMCNSATQGRLVDWLDLQMRNRLDFWLNGGVAAPNPLTVQGFNCALFFNWYSPAFGQVLFTSLYLSSCLILIVLTLLSFETEPVLTQISSQLRGLRELFLVLCFKQDEHFPFNIMPFEKILCVFFFNPQMLIDLFALMFFPRGHNQRMEFLGDSIMQLVATEYLFIHFPDHHEGHLTVSLY